jgi:hypothetical protein
MGGAVVELPMVAASRCIGTACRRVPPAARAKLRSKHDGEQIAIKNERQTMFLLSTPFFASALYIGGGTVGLLLVIVVVVLLLRR